MVKRKGRGSFRGETPGSNPIHGYDFSFSLFSLLPGHSELNLITIIVNSKQIIVDNSKFKANYALTMKVNLEKRSC